MKCIKPYCGGSALLDEDPYEKYLTCNLCGKEYDLDGKPREVIHLPLMYVGNPERRRPDEEIPDNIC